MKTGLITEHFTWEEAAHSELASRYGIDNSIPEAIEPAILNTARCMERVRTLFHRPVIISSWYRCPDLNYKLKSAQTSQHLKGEAVDFSCPAAGNPATICKLIISWPELISFDQLILEHNWIHISFTSIPSVKNRGQVLSLLKSGKYASGLTNQDGIPL